MLLKAIATTLQIKMQWQAGGDYLIVKVLRKKTKTKKTTNLEIFAMREKEIPIESREMPDNVTDFKFEPKGNRFGIIRGEGQRPTVDFFAMKHGKLKPLGQSCCFSSWCRKLLPRMLFTVCPTFCDEHFHTFLRLALFHPACFLRFFLILIACLLLPSLPH